MPHELTVVKRADAIEAALIGNDLSKLNVDERLNYYNQVCESLGLNPLTKPFEYVALNGKLQLYAKRDATEQLRKIHGVSIADLEKTFNGDLYIVTAKAIDNTGRCDISTGAVNIGGLKGENLANAIMKAETKAKRRVTLSICGLGLLDETEVASVPGAKVEGNWNDAAEKQAIVDRKLKELKPKDEPATEADEIERWKKLISVCVTADDFNAMIPQVKDKPNVVKMALMTASLDRGLTFDKSVKRFCGPTDTLAPPQSQTSATEPAKTIESGLEDVPDSPKRVEGLYYQEVTVKDAERRNLKAPKKGQYILLTCRVQGSDQDLPVSVWDTKLHEYALGSKDKVCEFGLKRKESGDRTYYSLETIEHIGGRKFIDSVPVDGPTGKDLFA